MLKKSNRGFSLKGASQREKRGFSLVELVVVIAIIGILVMLGSGRFMGRTKEANMGKHLANVKILEDSMERYLLDHDRFPRLSETPYTSDEIEAYGERIYNITGKEVTLNPKGNYYDIDYVTLRDYVKVPDKRDKANYILQNPAGRVYYIEGLTEVAKERADFTTTNPKNSSEVTIEKNGLPKEELDELINTKKYIPVSTPEDLNAIRSNSPHIFAKGTNWQKEYRGGLDKNYIQVENIDMSMYGNFSPIGNNTSGFKGFYNGGKFTISNLTININNGDYLGLFGFTSGATLENIRIIDANVKGRNHVGGLGGRTEDTKIFNSYVRGNVDGIQLVGGLVGFNYQFGEISNSHFEGNVVGDSYVGGITGWNQNRSNINNSYSIGKITGRSLVGGLVGSNHSSTIDNSYYDKETSGQGSSSGGTGLSTEEMQKESSYNGWDFDTIWQIKPGEYPKFR